MASIILDSNTNKIQGDFDNATLSSRTAFQTSTLNANTGVNALPNGTATIAGWGAVNNSDPTNASTVQMIVNGSTDAEIVSGRNGSGTYLPLGIYTNNTQRLSVTTTGALVLGTGTSNYGTSGQVLTSSGNGVPTWSTLGMTLLGGAPLATTSGTSAVLSGLTLTSYKQVLFVLNGVSNSGTTGNLTMTDPNATVFTISAFNATAANGITGSFTIDLTTGVLWGTTRNSVTTTLPDVSSGGGNNVTVTGKTTFSTSATSFTFGASAGAFDAGSIYIYGVA